MKIFVSVCVVALAAYVLGSALAISGTTVKMHAVEDAA